MSAMKPGSDKGHAVEQAMNKLVSTAGLILSHGLPWNCERRWHRNLLHLRKVPRGHRDSGRIVSLDGHRIPYRLHRF